MGFENVSSAATETVILQLTQDQDTYQQYQYYADQHAVHSTLSRRLHDWFEGGPFNNIPEAEAIITGFVVNSARRVDWSRVLDALDGTKPLPQDADPVTKAAYAVLTSEAINWQEIAEDEEYKTDQETNLQNWLEETVEQWVKSSVARANRPRSEIGQFAYKGFTTYLNAVNWQQVQAQFETK
jgi:hypothetical protein